MISPLTPRQAAELLLAASLRTGGMTQTEWLATLGGPGSGNFGHAGRPGEVGGSAPEGGGAVAIKEDTVTGAAPAPELAAQSAKGIAACEKLLDTAVEEAKYGRSTASASTDWSQVDPKIQSEVEDSLRSDIIERLEDDPDLLDLSGLNREFKGYLRTDEERVKELTQSAAEAVKAEFAAEGFDISTQSILDNLTIGDADEAPAIGGDAAAKFENGEPLTEDQIATLSDSWDQAYAAEESSAFDNRDSDDWYQEAYSDMQKDYLNDAMDDVDDIQRFDRAHSLGYDDDQLFESDMEPGEPTEWLTGTREPETPEDYDNYNRTAAIVREMAYQRSQEIAAERGLSPPSKEDIKDIWYSWKGSSQGMKAREFQQAVADELGGVTRFTELQANDLRNRSDFGRMKAYVRGQWETNQWLMNKAGQDYIDVYRGVLIPTEDIERSGVTMHIFGNNDYGELPSISLQRNGAQSTTSNPDVANSWGGVGSLPTVPSERVVLRIRAPRTSVISLPVYGDNEHNESETVLAGTRDRWWWDLWRSRAPEFNVHPPKPVHRAAALNKDGEIVIDFFEIDQQYPEHWLSRKVKRLGGPGSGNFGHAGRPGEVGGSGDGTGSSADLPQEAVRHIVEGWQESYETVIEFREISKGVQKETEEFRQFKKAISSLPREKGPTYRGFQATDLSQFEEGAEVDIDAFASSTKDYSGAEFYARREHDELLKEALFNNEPTSPVIMVFKGGSQFKAKVPDTSAYADMKEVIIEPSKWRIKTSHDVYPSGKKLREVILVPR